MRVAFRVDASLDLGTGHVVRCSSLAEGLRRAGHEILFCCADWPGNMIDWLERRGFEVTRILPSDEQIDAIQTREIIGRMKPHWLIVDHYHLGIEWEKQLIGAASHLMVIDDLGRAHACDALLDQNYSTPAQKLYAGRIPKRCDLLLGPSFALLRPEFSELRNPALSRRAGKLERILIFMSGIDEHNETTKAFDGVAGSHYKNLAIDVAIGAANPHRAEIEKEIAILPHAQLHVQTDRMAELMTKADLMICAGGTTNWERCTLGLPALLVILADNQAPVAEGLTKAGAQVTLGWYNTLASADYTAAVNSIELDDLLRMSGAAAGICDGRGVERVIRRLENALIGTSQ